VAHICSLVHQRYSEFPDLLRKELVKVFEKYGGKDEERAANVTRFRVTLRLLGELILSGVLLLEETVKLIRDILSNLINCDKESHIYVQVVISFARHCGEDFAGVLPRRQRQFVEKHNITWPNSGVIPAEAQSTFRSLLQSYYSSLAKHLLKAHKDLQNRERQNRHILMVRTYSY
jgi:regulator of nonsense transcripts 2